MKPNISILLTSYNHEKFINLAIESILTQSYLDFELLIWDDFSIDNSWNIIKSYNDSRIRIFRNSRNEVRGSLNKMIQKSRGKYICIAHSDDMWEPNKLERQLSFLYEKPEIGAVFSNALIINEDGNPLEDQTHFYYNIFTQSNRSRFEWLNHFFFNGNALCHPSVMIRKSCYDTIGIYRNGLVNSDDFDLWVRLCMKYDIHVFADKLVRFRLLDHDKNSSADHPDSRVCNQFSFLKVLDHYKKIPDVKTLVKIFPEAVRYINNKNPDIHFALAMIALNFGNNNPTKLFGLNLLFDALNDPIRAKNLRDIFNFDQKSFYNLTKRNDVFSINLIQDLNHSIEKQKKEIDYYKLSRSWRITRPLRRLMNIIRMNRNV